MFFKPLAIFLLLLLTAFMTSCQSDKLEFSGPKWYELNPKGNDLYLLHIAHTRMKNDSVFNKKIMEIDYNAFDLQLLGGDMAKHTSYSRPTMDTLDQVFNFGDSNTLWALGNHDYDDPALVQEYTQRPLFYTFSRDQLTFLVLDTQDSLSNFVGNQMEMIQNVVDTISTSSHLILLHHKLIWLYNNENLQDYLESISNGEVGELPHTISPNNFYSAIYPQLLEVEEKGIEVFCIGGDLGTYTKTFFYHTPEGIDFLASGFFENDSDNQVLILKYNPINASMDFEFVMASDL